MSVIKEQIPVYWGEWTLRGKGWGGGLRLPDRPESTDDPGNAGAAACVAT
ncbi:MAG: hypothetical protein QGF03_05020 [SAR324 cluster bacterium]|nr:hypothetical protein [SAR324 cluster bacterium]